MDEKPVNPLFLDFFPFTNSARQPVGWAYSPTVASTVRTGMVGEYAHPTRTNF